jgi:hypothetical protein
MILFLTFLYITISMKDNTIVDRSTDEQGIVVNNSGQDNNNLPTQTQQAGQMAQMAQVVLQNVPINNLNNQFQTMNQNGSLNVTQQNVPDNTLASNQESRQQKISRSVVKGFKMLILHPASFLATTGGSVYFIYKDQMILGVWTTIQFVAFMLRYTFPNCCISRPLNNLAKYCNYSVPVDASGNEILPISEKNGKTGYQQLEGKQIEEKGGCQCNCKTIGGWALMSPWSFLITAMLLAGFIYDDSLVLGVIMTLQIILYFFRTKFPTCPCSRTLNKWARDVGVNDVVYENEQ